VFDINVHRSLPAAPPHKNADEPEWWLIFGEYFFAGAKELFRRSSVVSGVPPAKPGGKIENKCQRSSWHADLLGK
jgi:hypothetical protein